MEAGFIEELFLLSFLLALTGLWIFHRGFLRCWYASQGGRGKTPFQWARVDFSSDGLKAKADPRLLLNQFLEFSTWFSRCA